MPVLGCRSWGAGGLGLGDVFPDRIRLEPGAPGSVKEAQMGREGLKSRVLWLERGVSRCPHPWEPFGGPRVGLGVPCFCPVLGPIGTHL